MRDRRQGLTDADFNRMKAERDAALTAMAERVARDHLGWDGKEPIHYHASGASGCYCACPDGPCQHQFEGWREITADDDETVVGGETVCKHCGLGAMSHDLTFMP